MNRTQLEPAAFWLGLISAVVGTVNFVTGLTLPQIVSWAGLPPLNLTSMWPSGLALIIDAGWRLTVMLGAGAAGFELGDRTQTLLYRRAPEALDELADRLGYHHEEVLPSIFAMLLFTAWALFLLPGSPTGDWLHSNFSLF